MAEETKQNTRGRMNEAVGEVVSDKMDKTISVLIYRQVRHKKYGKIIRRSSIFKAHDETNQARIGDRVSVTESRPLSKTKRWKLSKVLEKASDRGVGI